MNRQTDDQSKDKPVGQTREHGDLSENPRPDGPDHDAPVIDEDVINKTLPRPTKE